MSSSTDRSASRRVPVPPMETSGLTTSKASIAPARDGGRAARRSEAAIGPRSNLILVVNQRQGPASSKRGGRLHRFARRKDPNRSPVAGDAGQRVIDRCHRCR